MFEFVCFVIIFFISSDISESSDSFENSIEKVKQIFNSVIESLTRKGGLKSRKFSFVEISYFSRYWNEISEEKRNVLRKLVEDKKLQFVSGGWVMNDEATPHYSFIIDQMTLGHNWLNRTFGSQYLPTTGWQIDPFGHSREYASILSQMGFNGLFLGRIDYQDKKRRYCFKNLEFIWETDSNVVSNKYLFTGITPHGYNAGESICINCDNSEYELIVQRMSQQFLDTVKNQFKGYASNQMMVTMGEDFEYTNAEKWYKRLDFLIKSVNRIQNEVHLLYSTPDCYLKSLYNANKKWNSIKTEDFFPYADKPNAYWSGYYTSRPTLKYYIIYANSILQIAKQLIVIANVSQTSFVSIIPLQESVALTQHHDAITGTSKQYVAEDYIRMLDNGIFRSQTAISEAYQKLFNTKLLPQFCHQLNISQCLFTENISHENIVEIVIYNPISYQLTHYICLPITRTDFQIIDSNEKVIDSEIIPIPRHIRSLSERNSSAEFEICFEAVLHPLSFSKYYIKNIMRPVIFKIIENISSDISENIVISNNKLNIIIDKRNGLLKSIVIDGQLVDITQNFHCYTSNVDNPSGAYSMHTNGTITTFISDKASVSVIRNNLFEEVVQEFNPWLSQIIRVYRKKDYVEFDWIVGPLPTDQDIEVITRFDTNFKTESTFFTDSNGRQTLKRKCDFRETWNLRTEENVSSNYYPITSWISIKDLLIDLQLTVLPDRPQGGSSLRDDSIELMIHRRLTRDDAYGVVEPLNEKGFDGRGLVVRGKHFLILSKAEDHMKNAKKLSKQLYWKPLPLFTTVLKPSFEKSTNSSINEIDDSIHLLTLEELNDNNILLRLEYILEINETNIMTKNILLNKLFANFKIIDAIETSLTGIEIISEVERRKFNWDCDQCNQRVNSKPFDKKNNFLITLKPNKIRTFRCKIKRKGN